MSRCAILPGQTTVIVDELMTRRVGALIGRVGKREAIRLLGIGEATFEAARNRGSMQRPTRDRILKRLVEIEGVAKDEAAE